MNLNEPTVQTLINLNRACAMRDTMHDELPDSRRESREIPEDTRFLTIEMYEDVFVVPVSEEEPIPEEEIP